MQSFWPLASLKLCTDLSVRQGISFVLAGAIENHRIVRLCSQHYLKALFSNLCLDVFSNFLSSTMVRTARKATKVTTAAKNTAASSQKKAQKALEDENADLRRRIGMVFFSALMLILNFDQSPTEQLQQAQKSEGSFIPKPKGQAGRGDGYNLYEEMRLSSHATYNVIRVLHFFII